MKSILYKWQSHSNKMEDIQGTKNIENKINRGILHLKLIKLKFHFDDKMNLNLPSTSSWRHFHHLPSPNKLLGSHKSELA